MPEVLRQPTKIRRGSIIFVNSMSDLFHEDVPLEYILQVFQIMKETPRHIYQVLTKRADRLLALSTRIEWPHNVWMGVSVESQDYADRVDMLKETEAEVKFLSLEPLLGPLALDLSGIDWVIAGGESGPSARPIEADWVRSLRDLCVASETAFHFKQWGGVNKKRSGRTLDSRTWQQWPIDMQRWVQAEGPTAQSDLLS